MKAALVCLVSVALVAAQNPFDTGGSSSSSSSSSGSTFRLGGGGSSSSSGGTGGSSSSGNGGAAASTGGSSGSSNDDNSEGFRPNGFGSFLRPLFRNLNVRNPFNTGGGSGGGGNGGGSVRRPGGRTIPRRPPQNSDQGAPSPPRVDPVNPSRGTRRNNGGGGGGEVQTDSCAGTGFTCDSNFDLNSINTDQLPSSAGFGLDQSLERELREEVDTENRETEDTFQLNTAGGGYGGGGGGAAPALYQCAAESRLIIPTSGRNYRNQQRKVVQYPGRFTQFFKLRICQSPDYNCGGDGYSNAKCIQEYNYQRVLVQEQARYGYGSRLYWDWFRIPTCCSCQAYVYGK